MKYISFNIIIELICFLFAIRFLLKDNNFWRLMLVYMGLVVITEVTGKYLAGLHQSNQWVYNIFLLIEAGFVGAMFYHILKKNKAWILSGLFLLLVPYTLEVYHYGFMKFLSYTNIVSSILFICFSFYYYFMLINEENYHDLVRHDAFWWVTGAIFYYSGGTVCNFLFDYLSRIESTTLQCPIRYIIFCVLNFLLYAYWCYSF
jgi:hypothetical protein